MVKANTDRILEILKEKKSVSIGEISKTLNLPKKDLKESAEYLEEDGVVKIDYKFPKTIVTLVKDPGNVLNLTEESNNNSIGVNSISTSKEAGGEILTQALKIIQIINLF